MAASCSTNGSAIFPAHPHLKTPSLFIGHLPSHVLEAHIKEIFTASHPEATVSFNRSKNRRNRGALRPRIDFPDLYSAEKALATLNERPIPSTNPLVVLKFHTTSTFKTLEAPDAGISPRVIKSLPAIFNEAAVFDLLRPYGPIYSVRIDPIAGGLVQFWDDAQARDAEARLAATEPKTILNAYDPCSLFCSNISFDLDPPALRTHFAEYGRIISADILTHLQTGKSRGIGFITFALASEASAAMHAMNGVDIQWRALSVSYRILKKNDKKRNTKIGTAERYLGKGDSHAYAYVQPEDSISPSKCDSEVASGPPPPSSTPATNGRADTDSSALQTLYDAEVCLRKTAQAESALLQEQLESTQRLLEMAESRLKIMQLEADRPLWEAAKKQREEEEKAERERQEARRRAAEVEESRRKMREFQAQEKERKRLVEEAERQRKAAVEAAAKAQREKEEQERKKREREERERLAKEAREKRERENRWKAATIAEQARCHKRDEALWGSGAWTPARALERLKLQMDEFDKVKFSEAQPLTFGVVPWPVLTDPLDLDDIEQINWDAVEAFFARAKLQLAANVTEYNSLVEKVHRMFHPDKWKARGVLVTVMDDELRGSLETAGNIVAQAMTPLWRKSKGYNS